jgi:hypothetical protein
MAAGERSVKIKFTGDTKGLDRAAKAAEASVDKFGSNATKSISKVAAGIPDLFAGVVDSLPPMGKPIALALVAGLSVVLAPLLGAAITAALLTAVGGGVLALGIKSAIDNPKVAKALDGLKSKASKLFDDFGKPFEKPLVRASETFGKLLDDLRPYVDRISKAVAPLVDKLAPALAEFLRKAMPGIEKAVAASVPLFETLAEKLPKIGEAVSLFFEQIAANGDDANRFFSDMLDLITGLIVGIGWLIAKLASWYSDLRAKLVSARDRFVEFKVAALAEVGKLLDGAVKALSWIPGIGPKLQAAQRDFQKFQADANKELQKIRDRNVSITISTNIGTIAGQYANLVAGIVGKGGKVSGRRASGGPVSAGRSYLVGERGPEVITMGSQGGRVTPNRELTGGGDVYEFHIDLGNQVRQVIRVHDRDIKRRTRAAGAYA